MRRSTPYRVYRRANWLMTRIPGAGLLRVPPKTTEWAVKSWTRTQLGRDDSLPTAAPTLRLGTQVAMDEAILGVMMRPSKFPSTADYERVGEELSEAARLYRSEGWTAQPDRYHRTPPPLTDPQITTRRWLLNHYEHLTWESGFEPHPNEPARERWIGYEAPRTAHAHVLRHRDDVDRPWLLCLHGFGMGYVAADFQAFRAKMLHRELGLNLVFPVMPLHGRRAVDGANDLLSFDLLNTVFGIGQAIWDTRRLLSWLRTQTDQPIGAYGISLGGYTGSLLSTQAELDLMIAGIPAVDFPELFRHHAPNRVERAANKQGLLGSNATDAHQVISPLALPTKVPERRRFIYAGLGDRMVPPPQPRSLWHHWGGPETCWFPGSHIGFMWNRRAHEFVRTKLIESGFVGDPDLVGDDATTPAAA